MIILLFVLFCTMGVSSANVPKTQTFTDVEPSSPYYEAVEKCYAAGIMLGFGDGTFRPDDPLPRWQAAVVIERAAFGEFTAPPFKTTLFDDVDEQDYYQGWVEDFGRRGITSGCGTRLFCPYLTTTRDAMAVFLIRSLGEFNPPTPATQRFADVPPSHPFYNFIDRLAELNITNGCGEGNYCPSLAVTRGDCAVFVVRAYGL